jgi:hypothetical protein
MSQGIREIVSTALGRALGAPRGEARCFDERWFAGLQPGVPDVDVSLVDNRRLGSEPPTPVCVSAWRRQPRAADGSGRAGHKVASASEEGPGDAAVGQGKVADRSPGAREAIEAADRLAGKVGHDQATGMESPNRHVRDASVRDGHAAIECAAADRVSGSLADVSPGDADVGGSVAAAPRARPRCRRRRCRTRRRSSRRRSPSTTQTRVAYSPSQDPMACPTATMSSSLAVAT